MLGVVHQGVAFPVWCVYWTSRVIPTQGADQAVSTISVFPERQIACLTADRELLDKVVLLSASKHTPFCIRTLRITNWMMGESQSANRFSDLQPGQQSSRHQRKLWGYWLYVAALRLNDGSLLLWQLKALPKQRLLIMQTVGALKHCLAFSKLAASVWNLP